MNKIKGLCTYHARTRTMEEEGMSKNRVIMKVVKFKSWQKEVLKQVIKCSFTAHIVQFRMIQLVSRFCMTVYNLHTAAHLVEYKHPLKCWGYIFAMAVERLETTSNYR